MQRYTIYDINALHKCLNINDSTEATFIGFFDICLLNRSTTIDLFIAGKQAAAMISESCLEACSLSYANKKFICISIKVYLYRHIKLHEANNSLSSHGEILQDLGNTRES